MEKDLAGAFSVIVNYVKLLTRPKFVISSFQL